MINKTDLKNMADITNKINKTDTVHIAHKTEEIDVINIIDMKKYSWHI